MRSIKGGTAMVEEILNNPERFRSKNLKFEYQSAELFFLYGQFPEAEKRLTAIYTTQLQGPCCLQYMKY